jgi:hypothetical protein
MGSVSPGAGDDGDDEASDDETPGQEEEAKEGGDNNNKESEEEEFVIPRSIREIYMISNRNRRNKKAGSPTPERGVMTPTSEKEREELARAEALLQKSGAAVMGYFDDPGAGPGMKRPCTPGAKSSGRESEESVPSDTVPSKEDDVQFMKDIGWLYKSDTVEFLTSQPCGSRDRVESTGSQDEPIAVKELNRHTTYGYDDPGVMPATQQPNPFFQGETLMKGGPFMTQSMTKSDHPRKSSSGGKGGGGRRRRHQHLERPSSRTDSRTHGYRERTENQR